MEMIEILKTRLPEGVSVVKVQDRSGYSQIKILLSYEGREQWTSVYKTCTPGKENHICDMTITTAMIGFALERNDLDAAKVWLDRQRALAV